MTESTSYSLRSLLAAQKGNLNYTEGDAFLLHVFWEAPSAQAAHELLAGLQKCANATHRDTPCVPSYFFRISNNDSDICSAPPRTVNDHPHLRAAMKKLQLGVPLPAIRAELVKRGLDSNLIDMNVDDELPSALQKQPVRVEFTEIYLDERAFMEHAGSRDYLDGYGVVMNPSLHYTIPSTLRMGTPPMGLVERILEPVLHEIVVALPEGCCSVWKHPTTTLRSRNRNDENVNASTSTIVATEATEGSAVFLSIDIAFPTTEQQQPVSRSVEVASMLSAEFREHCTTCVVFAHPLRVDTTRLMCILPILPPPSVLSSLSVLPIARGEAHTNSNESVETVRAALADAGISLVSVNASPSVGYVLHEKASILRECKRS